MQLEPASVKILLGRGVAEDTSDSRLLAASIVFQLPDAMRDVPVREFLGWTRASTPTLVEEYQRAATIAPAARLGDLRPFQRAALIGALRLRRRIEEGSAATKQSKGR